MRPILLRVLITLTTFAVVWLIVTPARASAPVCDPRGATMFAPPPQIQDEELSLDVVSDCAPESPLDVSNAIPGQGPRSLDWSSSQEPVAAPAIAVPVWGAIDRVDAPQASSVRPPRGVTTSLERPPQI